MVQIPDFAASDENMLKLWNLTILQKSKPGEYNSQLYTRKQRVKKLRDVEQKL